MRNQARAVVEPRRRWRRPAGLADSGGGDGDLHAGLAVAREAADEVVDAALQRDAVVAGGERPDAPGRGARVVPGRAHRHHVVRLRAVPEHCASTIVLFQREIIKAEAAQRPFVGRY